MVEVAGTGAGAAATDATAVDVAGVAGCTGSDAGAKATSGAMVGDAIAAV